MSLALYWSAVLAELARLMTWREWFALGYTLFGIGFWGAALACASRTHDEPP